ncbi:hypothetical protein SHO565_34300 [Streptomyces sp. HO565]
MRAVPVGVASIVPHVTVRGNGGVGTHSGFARAPDLGSGPRPWTAAPAGCPDRPVNAAAPGGGGPGGGGAPHPPPPPGGGGRGAGRGVGGGGGAPPPPPRRQYVVCGTGPSQRPEPPPAFGPS